MTSASRVEQWKAREKLTAAGFTVTTSVMTGYNVWRGDKHVAFLQINRRTVSRVQLERIFKITA